MRLFGRILKDRRGATAVEYGLILAMVFLAMIAGVTNFANSTTQMWNEVSTTVAEAR